jgi:hypothetical protein
MATASDTAISPRQNGLAACAKAIGFQTDPEKWIGSFAETP